MGEKMTDRQESVEEIGTIAVRIMTKANPDQYDSNVYNAIVEALTTERTLRLEVEAKLAKGIADLNAQLAIQEDEPSTATDGYMCGLLNGMLLAKTDLTGCEYRPKSYRDEKVASLSAHLELCLEGLKKIEKWEFDIMGDCVTDAKNMAKKILSSPSLQALQEKNEARDRVVGVLEKSKSVICNSTCPSVWVIVEGQKHSELCKEVSEALAALSEKEGG